MRILYVGHLEEGTSWSEASFHTVAALQEAGLSVVCRSIKLNGNYVKPPQFILDSMSKSVNGCTVNIQNVLPNHYSYTSTMRNIAQFFAETTSFRNVGWSYRIGMMDEVWVPNRELATHLSKEVNIPIHVIPLATNVAKYDVRLCDKFQQFTFYSVIDITERKNLGAILKAFHAEFRPEEDVHLVLKVSKFGHNPDQCVQLVNNENTLVKGKLGLYGGKYKELTVHAGRLTDNEMAGLHQSCHCFVLLSRGEGWSYITIDALGYGNDVIVSNVGGPKDYVPFSSGLLIDGFYEPATGSDSLPFYQGGDSRWFEPSVSEAMKAMRQKFNEHQQTPVYMSMKEKDRERNRAVARSFSYENVGILMREILCG